VGHWSLDVALHIESQYDGQLGVIVAWWPKGVSPKVECTFGELFRLLVILPEWQLISSLEEFLH